MDMAAGRMTYRPLFVQEAQLREEFTCILCDQTATEHYQTVCGSRVCQPCIDGLLMEHTAFAKVTKIEEIIKTLTSKLEAQQEFCDTCETGSKPIGQAMQASVVITQEFKKLRQRLTLLKKPANEIDEKREVIGAHANEIKRNRNIINDMENRMKFLEMNAYDGELNWKISDYSRKKLEAVEGKRTSLYSSPFYTSRYGYKMCCRVFLNGDGETRNKYLGLFFVLLKGEFDELLQFPFKHQVTFTLICPSNPNENKDVIFSTNLNSSSFRRPQTEMNIASGCPQFALQSEVESSKFLVSDSIYIRVKVEVQTDWRQNLTL